MSILSVQIRRAGYIGKETAVHDIDFHVKQGEFVGLIGANGAGKSTTMKLILGFLEEYEGLLQIETNKTYTYIPEHPIFYEGLTLWEHLEYIAKAYLVTEWQERVSRLLQDFRMEAIVHQLPASFSKGMQQKSMIIAALLVKADLYLIDEPFIGLDPHATSLLLRFLKEEQERGAAILMSTHVLDTAEKICDRFILISNGTIVAQGSLEDLRATANMTDGSLLDCFNLLWEKG
ncbi:ABC transporter ATP-binding protein [Paenibacillus larvae]